MPSTHTSLTYHLVFSTKNREPLLDTTWRPRLFAYFGGCLRTTGGVLLEAGGSHDHVHLLAGLKATQRVCDVLRDIKKEATDWVRGEIHVRGFAWQEGYGAFTVNGQRCPSLVRYIRNQEEHHRATTFEEEYRAFLDAYGIEFDERYLW